MTALIGMRPSQPLYLTVDEYEQLKTEVETRIHLGACGLPERILAQLLVDTSPRYHDAKAQERATKYGIFDLGRGAFVTKFMNHGSEYTGPPLAGATKAEVEGWLEAPGRYYGTDVEVREIPRE